MLSSRKAPAFVSIAAIVAIAVSGCSTATSTSGANGPARKSPVAATGCKVGVSWNNYQEERWAKWDEPAIKDALAASGAIYLSNDAKSSSDAQASNVDALINQGAKVVIILAQDGVAIKASVTKALAAGVAVIAYDRLIEDPGAFYITFDNVLVGHMQAAAIFAAKPTGNYVIIKGNKADANADFLRKGISEVLDAPVASGAIKIVGEQYTDNWDPTNAQNEMTAILLAQNNKVDAVVSENDGMAGGVVAALQSQGMAGTVPVSGQDGDAAALNRIALGTQTVDVWKDARMLGLSAGEAAAMLCNGAKLDTITTTNGNAGKFLSPGSNNLDSILLKPQAITKENLQIVLDAGWITKEKLCQGVTAGAVKGC